MSFETIGFDEGNALLSWAGLCEAFRRGHRMPRAEIADNFLYRGKDTLLSRSAWIDGMGLAVKSATIFPENAALNAPTINGAVSLFADATGELEALIDFHLVTKWKTAGDSLFGATLLARPDSRKILIVGAGTVAHTLHEAYSSAFDGAEFTIWNRSPAGAEKFAAQYDNVSVATDLEAAVKDAEIITSATMATEPLIMGAWLQPGQHVDLIGAFRPDMRETDDAAMQRARVFVDSRATTIGHIGEIQKPLDSGAITEADIVADLYDIESGQVSRQTSDEITLYKNGGGAHLDLMTSRHILDVWTARKGK